MVHEDGSILIQCSVLDFHEEVAAVEIIPWRNMASSIYFPKRSFGLSDTELFLLLLLFLFFKCRFELVDYLGDLS